VNTADTQRRIPGLRDSVIALVVVAVAMAAAFLYGRGKADRGIEAVFGNVTREGELVGRMQVELLASAEAEKSAVMADTDDASAAFAAESRRASDLLEADRRLLGSLIEGAGRPDPRAQFDEFSRSWQSCRELDARILDLAVQNTNLKASRLAFGPAGEALHRMQAALETAMQREAPPADAAAIARSAGRALVAAYRLHELEARHIAEARDGEMDRLEGEMQAFDGQVMEGLDAMAAAAGDAGQASVDEARGAYADFRKVHADVLELSRRNSNVQSLAASLGQKRKLTAACQELLGALQESIRSEGAQARR
jgi:hypothetical protein